MISTDLETFARPGSFLRMQVHLTQYLARHPSDWLHPKTWEAGFRQV